jgi:hypothetical protein
MMISGFWIHVRSGLVGPVTALFQGFAYIASWLNVFETIKIDFFIHSLLSVG